MGQARDDSLAQLLLLGEPEAVVAAVHAPGLTDELASRAWWAMPTSENARRMLEKPAVVEGETGKVLADFLIEFLPFEEEQRDMIESVRLVLQQGLISQEEKEKLWKKAKTKRSFYVGFLLASADDLPIEVDFIDKQLADGRHSHPGPHVGLAPQMRDRFHVFRTNDTTVFDPVHYVEQSAVEVAFSAHKCPAPP